MLAKSAKVRRYEQRIKEFRRTGFQKIYAELNWNKIIWGVRKEHNRMVGKVLERYQIGKPQGETVSQDIASRTSAV